MAYLGFEGNASIYMNQSLCSCQKILWSCSKKLHNMETLYNRYVYGDMIKIKIHENGDSVLVS